MLLLSVFIFLRLYILIKLVVETLLDTAFSLKFRMIPQPMIR